MLDGPTKLERPRRSGGRTKGKGRERGEGRTASDSIMYTTVPLWELPTFAAFSGNGTFKGRIRQSFMIIAWVG